MEERNFRAMLERQWTRGKTVCVGLDSEYTRIPLSVRKPTVWETVLAFNQAIVGATKDLVCVYKPNAAFYGAYGDPGWRALQETICHIHQVAPDVPVILDAKRADIGSTNAGYVIEAFGFLQADAITVHPYLGAEALKPFLEMKDKGIIVLCRTSNPGAGEFQDLRIMGLGDPLYLHVASNVANQWNKNGNCAVVVGATYPEELRRVREIVGDMPILIPGIGAQGGDLEKTVKAGRRDNGGGMIINSSRSIIFASDGPDFAEAARRETIKLQDLINQYNHR